MMEEVIVNVREFIGPDFSPAANDRGKRIVVTVLVSLLLSLPILLLECVTDD